MSWSNNELVGVSNIVVYYRETHNNEEMMVTVPSSVSSVVISLVTDRQYIIEVSAISIVNGISVSGYRTSYGPLVLSTVPGSGQQQGISSNCFQYRECKLLQCYPSLLNLSIMNNDLTREILIIWLSY